MTNLELLAEAEKPFSLKERESLDNHFIAILSLRVDSRIWVDAIKDALASYRRLEEYKHAVGGTTCA